MLRSYSSAVAAIVAAAAFCAASDQDAVVDVAALRSADLNLSFVDPHKDPATGFVVGGVNATDKLRELPALNGRPIAELERLMRPGADYPESSEAGFLGPEESLREVLAADNVLVREQLGFTHQQLARPLLRIGYYALTQPGPRHVIRYGPARLQVHCRLWRGYQLSPFGDGTKSNVDVTVENLSNGRKLEYSLLVPHMIERYGFYEGRGTRYRVEPRAIIEVLELRP